MYIISIILIEKENYNGFFDSFIGMEESLPNSDFFVFVQVRGLQGASNGIGPQFLIKDINEMYLFVYNALYRLTRK